MLSRTTVLVLFILALGLGLAACGGDDGDDAGAEPTTTAEQTTTDEGTTTEEETTTEDDGGNGETIQLAADPGGGLSFDQTALSSSDDSLTIEFTNESTTPHNVSVEGQTSETITEGTTTLELDLEEGEYEFVCAVGGHAAAGMRGTLTVG